MKQREFVFPGSINKIEQILNEYCPKSIFLIRGKQSYIDSGAQKSLIPIFNKFKIVEFCSFSVNPKLDEARIGHDLLKKSKADLIIAVGGGSVIDMAKIIKYLCILENLHHENKCIIPLVAVPTTAGTGSEVTKFAVIYVDGKKQSYESESLMPEKAIVDANLLTGQSKYQIAVSGIDALAQGIESYWSINSNSQSLNYSERAMKLIWYNLKSAIDGEPKSKEKLAEGAFFSGKAINIAKTTGPHALSYALTTNFNLPHGHAVAVFLPSFFSYNMDVNDINCNDERGPEFVKGKIANIRNILGFKEQTDLESEFHSFFASINIETRLNLLNIRTSSILDILRNVNTERMNNNPRIYSYNDYQDFVLGQGS